MQAGVLKGLTRINPPAATCSSITSGRRPRSPGGFRRGRGGLEGRHVGTADWNEIDTLIRQGLKKTDAKDADRSARAAAQTSWISTSSPPRTRRSTARSGSVENPGSREKTPVVHAIHRLRESAAAPARQDRRDRSGEARSSGREEGGRWKPPDERAKHRFYDSPGTWRRRRWRSGRTPRRTPAQGKVHSRQPLGIDDHRDAPLTRCTKSATSCGRSRRPTRAR